MTNNAISANNISKRYGQVLAVDQVSFYLDKGSVLVVNGASGSGKTTLLRLLAGLEVPDQGEVWINGKPANKPGWLLSPHKRQIGVVFQSPVLWPHLTVAGNILFGLGNLNRQQKHQRLDEILVKTELNGLQDRYPNQISGGQARRVALARALAPKPTFLLFDEPLTNLDSELKNTLLSVIRQETADTGASMIYITHDENETGSVGGQVMFMKEGRLLAE